MNLAELLKTADAAVEGVKVGGGDFELVAPGEYDMVVTAADGPLDTSSVNPSNPQEHGKRINIECTITGPKMNGRKVWMNNNIICYPKDSSEAAFANSQKSMAIGSRERKVMLDSIGKTGIETAEELVGATFSATVTIEKGTNGNKDRNRIKSIKPIGPARAASPSALARPQSSATASATTAKKMPWDK